MRYENLEQTPWLLAPGALADSDIVGGNVPIATQKQPLVECASFAIDPLGKSYADAYWYKELGAQPHTYQQTFELFSLFPTLNDSNASQAVELDLQQTIGGITFNWGLQFYFTEAQIRVWDRLSNVLTPGTGWKPTGHPLPRWTPGMWQHIKLTVSRASSSVFYDVLEVNGVSFLLQQSFSVASVGEKEQLNCAVQLDGNSTGVAYKMMVDAVSLDVS